jgi:chaperonin GroES
MALKVRPLGDRLLVEPIEQEAQTSSGIIIPETAKEKPQEGRVLAAGPGRLTEGHKRLPMEVGEGDRVLFAKYAGTQVKLEDKDLLILREQDVLALVAE